VYRAAADTACTSYPENLTVNTIIYVVGLIVVIAAVLSFFGLR